MFILGLTGTIGSGKSTVARFLVENGFIWYEIDKIAHQFLENSSPIYSKVIELFGTNNRSEIRKQAFNKPEKLIFLNKIIHPLIKKKIAENIKKEKQNAKIVLDAALLFEIGLDAYSNKIIAIISSEKNIKNRIKKERGLNYSLTEKIISSQKSSNFFKENSDFIIENNHSLENLEEEIRKLLPKLY